MAAAQGNRRMNAVPVLQYEPPVDFMRSAVYPPEDYLSTQFNASVQVYQFEPFRGNITEIFQHTLLRDRIDGRYQEENVASMPQFGSAIIPGAEAVFHANFLENRVGLARPHMRMIIVAGGAVAIVDASAVNPTSWVRLVPAVNGMFQTMQVSADSAPPAIAERPGRGERSIAGLYQGIKSKYMTGLTFQPSYFVPALHFFLFSDSGLVYRAYDEISIPGGDIDRFDFSFAQRSNPGNTGRYTIRDGKLRIQMGNDPVIVTTAPKRNTVTIESVTYVRQ